MCPEAVALRVGAAIPSHSQYAEVPDAGATAEHPGTPPTPGMFVGLAVLIGITVCVPTSQVYVVNLSLPTVLPMPAIHPPLQVQYGVGSAVPVVLEQEVMGGAALDVFGSM
jgi:hypothetical protein